VTGPDPSTPPALSILPAELARAGALLAGLDGRPVPEHVEVFDTVHRLLQAALATLDEA
jgi:hypothetical protein